MPMPAVVALATLSLITPELAASPIPASQAAPVPAPPAPAPAATGAAAAAAPAAAPAPPPAVAAMQRAAFLLGRWEGTGWIQMGPQRAAFRQQETVRLAAGGTVLIVDGLGHSTDPGQNDRIVHQAFAVLSYDAARQAYQWRAHRADGNEVAVTPDLSTDRFVWGFDVPSGPSIRFTITKTPAGDWLEVGEMTRAPGGPPMKFFEMTLRRVGDV